MVWVQRPAHSKQQEEARPHSEVGTHTGSETHPGADLGSSLTSHDLGG